MLHEAVASDRVTALAPTRPHPFRITRDAPMAMLDRAQHGPGGCETTHPRRARADPDAPVAARVATVRAAPAPHAFAGECAPVGPRVRVERARRARAGDGSGCDSTPTRPRSRRPRPGRPGGAPSSFRLQVIETPPDDSATELPLHLYQ